MSINDKDHQMRFTTAYDSSPFFRIKIHSKIHLTVFMITKNVQISEIIKIFFHFI